MNTATATRTLIGKCQSCKSLTRVERELVYGELPDGRPCVDVVGGYFVDCKDCGDTIRETKTAKQSAIKCGPKCCNATGPSCSCECGGKNHGGH